MGPVLLGLASFAAMDAVMKSLSLSLGPYNAILWRYAVGIVIVAVLWVIGVTLVMATLNGIFQTALYLYATTGSLPAGFEGADLGATFGPR